MVTRKDYELIADEVRAYCDKLELDNHEEVRVIAAVASVLRPTNPRYDEVKFIERCLYGTGREG